MKPRDCAPDAIRTHDTFFRREVLYPLSYRGNETPWYTLRGKTHPNGVGCRRDRLG